MHSLWLILLAFSAIALSTNRACADDGVWISQVSTTRAAASLPSAGRGEYDALVIGGRAFRPTTAQSNLHIVAVHEPFLDRQISQSGEGNWIVGVLTASMSSVRIEQSGFGNGVGVQQDGSGHQLTAIQADRGNEMLLTQSGDSHRLSAMQSGQQNVMMLQQSGSNNVMTAVQAGAMNTMGVVQSGNGNRLAAYQR
ncbi:hypothetical protein [Methylorubrum sp. GM97]|uniref:hypothetical protein n=1 Tax=Methylorubrum sp. GM97 TaxID=2938232 RepID=UPI00218B86E2|nr:hypothetical protein [Methylorubrum sp. GM97]BDL41800.1 hypothetical protein MSPGM_43900 [Methylorubrum sp. GM97]